MTLATPPRHRTKRGTLLTEARHVVLPDGIVSSGFPAVEATCHQIGLSFDSWQTDLNRCILAKSANGLYAADTVVLSIPRQVGKTWDVGALVFADCIINPGTTVVWTAHRFKVARETFNELKSLALTPAMAPHVDPNDVYTAAGNESITFRNGSRIVFAARERGAIRGFTKIDRLILDEAQILSEAALSDLAPTTNQADNPQIIFMGTPPRPSDPGEVFTRLRTEALEGDTRGVLYVEFSADRGASPDDRKQWKIANPSYPKRTPTRAMERLRKLLSEEDFIREAFGVWDAAARARVLPNWLGCLNDTKKARENRPDPSAIGIGVSKDRAYASIGVASVGDVPAVGAFERRRGVRWVIDEAARIQSEHHIPVVVRAKGPAETLVEQLEDAGLDVIRASNDDYLTACANLIDLVDAGMVEHFGDDDLDDAIAEAKWKSGDRRAFAPGQGEMLEAATLALWAADQPSESIYEDRGMVTL